MKEINLKHLVTQHVNSIDDDIDCTSSVMQKIYESNTNSSFKISFKRPLVAVLILFLISTITYAATNEILKLRNSSGEEIASIEIDDTDISHLFETDESDKIVTYEFDKALHKGTVMVIDTKNPNNYSIRNYSGIYKDYSEFAKDIGVQLLPKELTNFEFLNACVNHDYKMPSNEERAELADQNSSQRYYTFQLEKIDTIKRILYTYKKKDTNEIFYVQVQHHSDEKFLEYKQLISNYEIVNLGTVEAFLVEGKNKITSDSNNDEITVSKYENHHKLVWYEPKHDFTLVCTPDLRNANNYIFPDYIGTDLVQLGTEINKTLNEN